MATNETTTTNTANNNAQDLAGRAQNMLNQARDTFNQARDMAGNLPGQVRETWNKASERIGNVPDQVRDTWNDASGRVMETYDNMPKPIGQTTHAVLDYVTAGAFFLGAGFLWNRNRSAAWGAIAEGAMVLGMSLMTDYPGGVKPVISFKRHGQMDLVQAASAAALPSMLGFADEPEAWLFHGQAVNELAVVAFTDWSEGSTADSEIDRAA